MLVKDGLIADLGGHLRRNAPAGGAKRVVRGGSWLDDLNLARAVARLSYLPAYRRYVTFGFRVVRPPSR